MIREFKFFHGITIQTEGIQNIVRTLRAQWGPDLVDDLNAVHAIDAESELTRLLVNEITNEWEQNLTNNISDLIDDDIIRMITRGTNGGQRV